MSTLAKLKSEAAKVGAIVTREREGMSMVCRCEAPKGMIFCEGMVHEFVDDVYTGSNDYADIISRLGFGVMECPYKPDCDWCNPEEETNDN